VAGFDDIARVFDARDGHLIAALTHPFPKLTTAELSTDGSRAMTLGADGRAAVWDVLQSRVIAIPDPGLALINDSHLSADGNYLAAACSDNCVRLWDLPSGQLRQMFRQEQPPGEGVDTLGAPIDLSSPADTKTARGFFSLQFDPHDLWLAAVNEDGRVCVWDTKSGRQLLRWKLEPSSRAARLKVSPDGRRLALTGLDAAVRLFDLSPAQTPRLQ
jgi:WD40 repeat protein